MTDVPGTGTPTLAGECVGCGASRVSPAVCQECGEISDVPQDAFAIFGLTRSWSVDSSELDQRYEAISRVFRDSFTRLERSLVEEVNAAADALAEARFWRRKVDELRSGIGRR